MTGQSNHVALLPEGNQQGAYALYPSGRWPLDETAQYEVNGHLSVKGGFCTKTLQRIVTEPKICNPAK